MSDLLAFAVAAGAAGAFPWLLSRTVDAVVPIPPLPDKSSHNPAWWAAWSSIYAARPLGTDRKRAVLMRELAEEQIAAIGTPKHEDEWRWIDAWLDAYRAGFKEDIDTFGPLAVNGQGSGGTAFDYPRAQELVDGILDGTADDKPGELGRLGLAIKAIAAQRKRVVADSADALPWTEGDPNEVTIATTRSTILELAAAMDAAQWTRRGWDQVGHLVGEGASAIGTVLGGAASAVGDAIGSALGGALGGIGKGILPLVVVGGGAYLVWTVVR